MRFLFLTIVICFSLSVYSQTQEELTKGRAKLDKALATKDWAKVFKTSGKLTAKYPNFSEFRTIRFLSCFAGYKHKKLQKIWAKDIGWLREEVQSIEVSHDWATRSHSSFLSAASRNYFKFIESLQSKKDFDNICYFSKFWYSYYDGSEKKFTFKSSDKLQTLIFDQAIALEKSDAASSKNLFNLMFKLYFKTKYPLNYPEIHLKREKNITHCISKAELQLYDLVMAYRKANDLPEIPLSFSLSYVAHKHCEDQGKYDEEIEEKCNLHSWSDDGPWTECCYTSDHAAAKFMWIKPAELTYYVSRGYEISHSASYNVRPESALKSWQGSKPHNEVIINQGIWADNDWQAIGIGIDGNYANIWFGMKKDNVIKVKICE
jgi:hypothetical protein